MSWAEQLVRGLLCLAVAFEDCTLINTEVINLSDDENAVGTDDSELVRTFLIDSGASVHCCCRADWFTKFTTHHPKKRVRVASGQFVSVHAILLCLLIRFG